MDKNMEFENLDKYSKVVVLNPVGRKAIVTLWSSAGNIIARLTTNHNIDLFKSNVCCIGTLYGNGFRILIRNLLNNPQIDTLLLYGNDLGVSREMCESYFKGYVKEENFLGTKFLKIGDTNNLIPENLHPDNFKNRKVEIIDFGKQNNPKGLEGLADYIRESEIVPVSGLKRIKIAEEEKKVLSKPGDLHSHTVVRDCPVDAWGDLLDRIFNFGKTSKLKKGYRLELFNLKVVVKKPNSFNSRKMEDLLVDPKGVADYMAGFLSRDMAGMKYTYGNRIMEYYGFDCVQRIIEMLFDDIESRHCFISLWDTESDLLNKSVGGRPCLANVFFRHNRGKLDLYAQFRAHNALDAWLKNFYGLYILLERVSHAIDVKIGVITVNSLSISIDMEELERASIVVDAWNKKYNKYKYDDPNGNFTIYSHTNSDGVLEYVADHYCEGVLLESYRNKNKEKLRRAIVKDNAISDIGHALYIGEEIGKL